MEQIEMKTQIGSLASEMKASREEAKANQEKMNADQAEASRERETDKAESMANHCRMEAKMDSNEHEMR
jgi:hypothetical protein